MARQELIPGGYYLNETATRQYLVPGKGFIDEVGSTVYNNSISETLTGGDSVTSTVSLIIIR